MGSTAHENPAFENTEVPEQRNGEVKPKTSSTEIIEIVKTSEVSHGVCDITYGVEDNPSWPLSILLGMQHYLMMVGGTITIPYILTPLLCIEDDDPARGKITSTILFVSGIVTMMQTTLGVRLPIVQGGTFAFLLPTIAILTTSFSSCDTYDVANMTSVEKDELWMGRMREVQGAIIVASLAQVIIGFTGLVGFLLTWITPLTIVPTVTLVGLSLFAPAADKASGQWGIAMLTTFLLILFSQYLANVEVPIPLFSKEKGVYWTKIQIFKLFPVILCLLISWGFCGILTATNALPAGSPGRTDTRLSLVARSPWFYVPYPFQWGIPTVSVSGVFGMLAGVISSIVESIGDYYACARLSGVDAPPKHAVNRGIGIEGVGCVIAGIIGTGNGTTSYSENIGAIRVTKVASRRVIQAGAMLMILFGMFGKFGAAFVTLPAPVVGGVFFVMFAVIAAVGLSNLQVVDLNSSRNLFVLGFSLFCGIAIPEWVKRNPDAIQTGSVHVDNIITILLRTHMFVGGALGFIFDNTIPGTDEERGLLVWREDHSQKVSEVSETPQKSCYDLPLGMGLIRRTLWCSKVPFSPTFKDDGSMFQSLKKRFQRES